MMDIVGVIGPIIFLLVITVPIVSIPIFLINIHSDKPYKNEKPKKTESIKEIEEIEGTEEIGIAERERRAQFRENERYQQVLNAAKRYITAAMKNAPYKMLHPKQSDLFAIDLRSDRAVFWGGVVEANLPAAPPKDDLYYSQYAEYSDFFSRNLVEISNLPFSGFNALEGEAMRMFIKCLRADLRAVSLPEPTMTLYAQDDMNRDTMLVWSLTERHPRKKYQAFPG